MPTDQPTSPASPDTTNDDRSHGTEPDVAARDEDQPDLDAFASRLGVVADGEEPDTAPDVTGAANTADRGGDRGRAFTHAKAPPSRTKVLLAVPAALLILGVLRRRRRR